MTTFSEKGHARNVANLGTLISFATGFGADYNPSKKEISLAALNALRDEAGKDLALVNTHFANWVVAVQAQQTQFARLNIRLTRIINAVANSEVLPAVITTAKALNRKLQGSGSRKARELALAEGNNTAEEATKTISTSRQSHESRIENLERLVQLLSEQPGYAPNEPDLNLSALQSLLADFKARNEAVKNAWMMLSNARISRNNRFYQAESGLVELAADVKRYVKSLYGAGTPQFKQVSSLSFIRIKS